MADWKNGRDYGEGRVMTDAVLLSGTPAEGTPMKVGVLDFLTFLFELSRVAATSVEWWIEATIDGVKWFRLPVNVDTSAPPDVTLANGEYTWAWAVGKEKWVHPNVRVTGLKMVRLVTDSTAGTTDTLSVDAYGESITAR